MFFKKKKTVHDPPRKKKNVALSLFPLGFFSLSFSNEREAAFPQQNLWKEATRREGEKGKKTREERGGKKGIQYKPRTLLWFFFSFLKVRKETRATGTLEAFCSTIPPSFAYSSQAIESHSTGKKEDDNSKVDCGRRHLMYKNKRVWQVYIIKKNRPQRGIH